MVEPGSFWNFRLPHRFASRKDKYLVTSCPRGILCSAFARNKVDGYQEAGMNRGLPPAMALNFASSFLLSKARMNLADKQLEAMQAKVYQKNIEDSK